jgi:hypothetical protein
MRPLGDEVRGKLIELALEKPELSPRELAVNFTDTERYFVSEASVCRSPGRHSPRQPHSVTLIHLIRRKLLYNAPRLVLLMVRIPFTAVGQISVPGSWIVSAQVSWRLASPYFASNPAHSGVRLVSRG